MAHIQLPNNPFVPPPDGRCIISRLPPELFSHIFIVGWVHERDSPEDEDEDEEEEAFGDADEDEESDEDKSDEESNDGSFSSASSSSDDDRSPTRRAEYEEERLRNLPFNVLVSHVCSQWRAVALETSLLWTHIDFSGKPPYDRALTYLARATTAPLSLRIDRTIDEDSGSESDFDGEEWDRPPPEDNDADLSIIAGIMDAIVPHIEHTQLLDIMVSFYPHIHCAMERLGACPGAPLLETLHLCHYEDEDDEESLTGDHATFKFREYLEQPFVLFGGHAPRLKEVVLWGVHLPWSKEGSGFLSGLVELELAYHAKDVRPDFTEFSRMLRTSPNLRALSLNCSGPAGGPSTWPAFGFPLEEDEGGMAVAGALTTSADPLVLASLENLTLAYVEQDHLLSLLPRFSLPALTSLTLDLEHEDHSDFLAYLSSPRSFRRPPQPASAPASTLPPNGLGPAPPRPRSLLANLTHLKVVSIVAQEPVVRDAYRSLTALTMLNLNVLYLGDYWLTLLFPEPSPFQPDGPENVGELLLPRLEALWLSGVDGARVRELVEARKGKGCPLRSVMLNRDEELDLDEEDKVWLKENLELFDYFDGSDDEEVGIVEDDDDDDDDGWEDAEDDDDDDDFGDDDMEDVDDS